MSAVRVGQQQEGAEQRGKAGPDDERQSEEHLQGDGGAQDLGQRGGDGGRHGAEQYGTAQGAGQMAGGGFGEAQPRHDAQMGHVVLQDDEHRGGERDHP